MRMRAWHHVATDPELLTFCGDMMARPQVTFKGVGRTNLASKASFQCEDLPPRHGGGISRSASQDLKTSATCVTVRAIQLSRSPLSESHAPRRELLYQSTPRREL